MSTSFPSSEESTYLREQDNLPSNWRCYSSYDAEWERDKADSIEAFMAIRIGSESWSQLRGRDPRSIFIGTSASLAVSGTQSKSRESSWIFQLRGNEEVGFRWRYQCWEARSSTLVAWWESLMLSLCIWRSHPCVYLYSIIASISGLHFWSHGQYDQWCVAGGLHK